MNIAIIGATGKAGSLITEEAIQRGHDVTAIVRSASKVNANVNIVEKDLFDLTGEDLKGFDVVVNAFNAPEGKEHLHIEAGRVLTNALKDAPKTRLVVIGGAGSLFVDEDKTVQLLETPDFPKAYYATAYNASLSLKELQNTEGLNWTYISPAAFFDPEGPKTGTYQTGKDHFIVNAEGQSYISYADYAAALLDEVEQPKHINERFAVVSK